MLNTIPLLHYFNSKNEYSGAEKGMRFLFSPGKRTVTGPDGTEQEEKILTVTVWPDPWALEHTDPALHTVRVFPLTEEGRQQAMAWLTQLYQERRQEWESCPGILDCEPWNPPKE